MKERVKSIITGSSGTLVSMSHQWYIGFNLKTASAILARGQKLTNSVFFSSKKILINLQYETFWYQSFASCLVYIPTLITTLFMVNINKNWNYKPEVVFNNAEFNGHFIFTIILGVFSWIMSCSPNYFSGLLNCVRKA